MHCHRNLQFVLVRKSVERKLQITATFSFWRGQTNCRQIDLEGRQHQIWHGQASISLGAEFDERSLAAVLQMYIIRLLDSDRALPTSRPTVRTIVMSGEKAGLARQLQNALNAAPELPGVASRKMIRSKESYAILARAAASSFGRSTMTSCPPGSLMTSHPGAPVYFLAKYRNGLGSHPSAKM